MQIGKTHKRWWDFGGGVFTKDNIYGQDSRKNWNSSPIIEEWFGFDLVLGTIHLRRRQIFTIFDPYPPNLASGIDVGPTFINFWFFLGPTALLEST